MALFDLIIVIILGGFVLFGLWFGLIHSLGALIGVAGGAWLAGHYYELLALKFQFLFYNNPNIARIVIFIILFVLVNRLIGLLFYLAEKIFNILSIVPFLKSIDRLAGAILGFLEGALVIGTILFVASKYPLGWFTEQLKVSEVAGYFIITAKIITPLLPKLLNKLKSFI